MLNRYDELGISSQIDYDKFYLYSIIVHSTAIEGKIGRASCRERVLIPV